MSEALDDGRVPPRLRQFFWVVAILLGAAHAWDQRFTIFSDGLSYVDVGDAYLRGDWSMALNGYWSPLYSWLIGLTLRATRPSPAHEAPVIQLLNLALYLFAFGCFDLLLKELNGYRRERETPVAADGLIPLPAWSVAAVGYAIFFWSSLQLITPFARATPDICVAGLMYLACRELVRIRRGSSRWTLYARLGVVLGFAALAKSVMFPVAFVFLVACVLANPQASAGRSGALVAALAFAVVTSPFVVALSRAKHRPTLGDTGRLNYVWYVDGIPWLNGKPAGHWQGQPAGTGIAVHPIRRILDKPAIYEFNRVVGGTYPPWYDPSYWYEGVVPRFAVAKQLRATADVLRVYAHIVLVDLDRSFLIGLFVLLWMSGRGWWGIVGDVVQQWPLLVPAVSGLGIYALIRAEPRLVGGFFAVLLLALFLAVRLPRSMEAARLATAVMLIVLVVASIPTAYAVSGPVRRAAAALMSGTTGEGNTSWQVADELDRVGLRRGERLGYVGDSRRFYWARLAGTRIVAESRDVETFWRADPALQAEAIAAFRHAGADLIVADSVPGWASTAGWLKAGTTGYYVYRW